MIFCHVQGLTFDSPLCVVFGRLCGVCEEWRRLGFDYKMVERMPQGSNECKELLQKLVFSVDGLLAVLRC